MLKAEQELASAKAGIGVAQAKRFPQFALGGALAERMRISTGIRSGPLFIQKSAESCGADASTRQRWAIKSRSMKPKRKQAALQYEKADLNALQEVEDAFIAVQKSREQRKAQEQQVAALQSAYNFAEQRYQGGRASYLDMLTSQRSLFESELALARTLQGQLVSVVQLYKALGGGWSVTDIRRTICPILEVAPQRSHRRFWFNEPQR